MLTEAAGAARRQGGVRREREAPPLINIFGMNRKELADSSHAIALTTDSYCFMPNGSPSFIAGRGARGRVIPTRRRLRRPTASQGAWGSRWAPRPPAQPPRPRPLASSRPRGGPLRPAARRRCRPRRACGRRVSGAAAPRRRPCAACGTRTPGGKCAPPRIARRSRFGLQIKRSVHIIGNIVNYFQICILIDIFIENYLL